MNPITISIIDGLVGGSHSPTGSTKHRKWNDAYSKLYHTCGEALLGYLSRSYPTLTWQDHQDILQTTLIAFRVNDALRTAIINRSPDRVDHANRLLFKLCTWRAQNWKDKRSFIQRHEGISLDAPISEDSTETLVDTVAACEDLLATLEDNEESAQKKDHIQHILNELVAAGARSRESIDIFRARLSGKTPAEVMEQFGVSRSKVDNLNYELRKQINQITALCTHGMSLANAIAASTAKPKSRKENA